MEESFVLETENFVQVDRTRPMIACRLDDTAPASGRTIQGNGLTCIGMARSLRGDL
jgi:hypothetical protein